MFRKNINLFEKILLPAGIGVTVFGFYMLLQSSKNGVEAIVMTIGVFTWLILLCMMIIAATNEDMKEELAEISREYTAEIKLLKNIQNEQLEELKLMRKK